MSKQQSGSIVIYTIVGVVLAGLLVGGIAFSQKRAEQLADRRGSTEQSSEPSKQEAAEQNRQSEKETDEQAEKRREAEESKRQQQERQAKEQAEKKARERELAEKAAQAQRDVEQAPVANEGPMARTGGAQAGDLPTTGPISDALGAVSGLLAIAAAGYVYYYYGRRP